MAPLLQALRTSFEEKRKDGTLVYTGNVDPEWTIAAIPHGGYALGLILDAAIQAQVSKGQHRDITHCTAHYLRSALVKPFKVVLRTLRTGKSFTNILADLIQDDTLRITTQLIFSDLPEPPDTPQLPTPTSLTLTQPSPYARVCPLETHPSQAKDTRLSPKFVFKDRFRWAEDNELMDKRNEENAKAGNGGLEWFAWIQLTDPNDGFSAAALPFCGDMFRNIPELLPRGQRAGPSWFPTMVLTLDFKVKLPASVGGASAKLVDKYAKRTMGLWSSGKFMQDGRHDNSVEVWTSPAELGAEAAAAAIESGGWRKEQHCLCVANQMALTLPLSVNEKRRAAAAAPEPESRGMASKL